MVAAKVKEVEAEKAKERMSKGGGDKKSGKEKLPDPIANQGQARDVAGKAMKVSGKTVDAAGVSQPFASSVRRELETVSSSPAAKAAGLVDSKHNRTSVFRIRRHYADRYRQGDMSIGIMLASQPSREPTP